MHTQLCLLQEFPSETANAVLPPFFSLLLHRVYHTPSGISRLVRRDRLRYLCSYCIASQTFKAWYEKKASVVREKEAEIEAARRKRGAMTGREIFAEVCYVVNIEVSFRHVV